jgi:hypothetical protein
MVRLLDTRRPFLLTATVLALGFAGTAHTAESEGQSSAAQATHSLTATATFGARTALEVSSQVLRFHVTDPSIAAEATVSFAAGARTTTDGEVVLVLELAEQGGAAQGALSIVGGSEGTIAGPVPTEARDTPTVAARWVGGGMRTGGVTFRLQAPPGQYDIPVKFQLRIP